MNDFEERLAELLNESVDVRLGTRRPAPPFDPPVDVETVGTADPSNELAARRRTRFTVLSVAATVVAVLAAALALGLYTSHHQSPTLHHHHHHPAPTPKLKSVRLGGATIVLPQGWVVRPIAAYQPKGTTAGNSPQWCLTPKSTPANRKSIFTCPVTFTRYRPSMEYLDPDSQTGEYSGGELPQAFGCLPNGDQRYREVADTRTFGGRAAEFRQWTVTCPKEPAQSYVEQQYTVPTAPGYLLSSLHSTARTRAAMTVIAAGSTLPAQTSPMRLADRGRVAAVATVSGAVRVTLTRVVQEHGSVTRVGASATYVVPKRLLLQAGTPKRGDFVYVATDGRTTTDFAISP